MTQQTKTYIIAVVGIVVIAGFLWWGNQRYVEKGVQDNITIGVIVSLTGPGSYYGGNIKKGVELAVYEINNAGGINGKSLQPIYEDDATDSNKTVAAAQKLINRNNIKAIVGIQWDFLANAVIPVVDQHEVVAISAAAPFDSLHVDNPEQSYMFTTFPSAAGAKEAVSAFFSQEDVDTAAIMVTNNDWGLAHMRAYQQVAEEYGIEILEIFQLSQIEGNDLRTELARIRSLNPDAVLLAVNKGDSILFTKRYRELGLEFQVLMHENFSDVIYSNEIDLVLADKFYFFEFPDPDHEFVERFQSYHGVEPQIAADTGYDAIYTLKIAIEAEDVTREGIARGMRHVSNYQGASGVIDFVETNYPKDKEALLKQVNNNEVIMMQ